jgi:hypothetical protein
MRQCIALLLMGLLLSFTAPAMTQDADLLTTAERTDFVETARYAEALQLCETYAARWPQAARCFDFGVTPEGRPLRALVATRTGTLDAASLRAQKVPVLLWQGGIHPGESDGKDAGFMVLRELLAHPASDDPLQHLAILFVPVLNVDGHERFGRHNRPNQVGPAEMGWRTNAQNYNLNRDYMKADSPEMQAMLRLLTEWDPILYADLHVTDGADFQHDVSVQVEPIHQGAEGLRAAGVAMRDAVMAQLEQQGSLPLSFYPNLVVEDDPASGFTEDAYLPRFSTGYGALRNRYALLLETHSWKDYKTRVRVTCNTLRALVRQTVEHGASWLQLASAADAEAMALGGKPVELDHDAGAHVTMLDFLGYAYTREPSAISGALVTRYDPSRPEVWHVPYRDTIVVTVHGTAPKAGYLVPAGYAVPIAERLAAHGIQFTRLQSAEPAIAVEVFRATAAELTPGTFEGRTMLKVQGEWSPETRAVPAGSLFVPIEQPLSRVVVALFEPRSPDAFLAWGFFNAAFEQKEYAEPYVAEQMARELLAADPGLMEAFKARLASDPAFAANPKARLDFFYALHPSWDEQYRLVPTYRVDRFEP